MNLLLLCEYRSDWTCSTIDLGSSPKSKKTSSKTRYVTPKPRSKRSCSSSNATKSRNSESSEPSHRHWKLTLLLMSLLSGIILAMLHKLSPLPPLLMIETIPQFLYRQRKIRTMTRWSRQRRTQSYTNLAQFGLVNFEPNISGVDSPSISFLLHAIEGEIMPVIKGKQSQRLQLRWPLVLFCYNKPSQKFAKPI